MPATVDSPDMAMSHSTCGEECQEDQNMEDCYPRAPVPCRIYAVGESEC